MLFFIIFLFGVFLTQLVVTYRNHETELSVVDQEVERFYGSLGASILSLYQAISGGLDWDVMVAPLMSKISPAMGLLFALYTAFAMLSLMNVATGVIVDSVTKKSKEQEKTDMEKQIRKIFHAVDKDGSKEITWEEFQGQLHTSTMQRYFEAIDIDMSEAEGLFRLLDINGSGAIDIEEFLNGCIRFRGPAKALDLCLLLQMSSRTLDRVQVVIDEFLKVDARLQMVERGHKKGSAVEVQPLQASLNELQHMSMQISHTLSSVVQVLKNAERRKHASRLKNAEVAEPDATLLLS